MVGIAFEDVRNSISVYLQSQSYGVEFNVKLPGETSTIDIVATKGGMRKKVIYIAVSSNPFEASIAAYLLKDMKGKNKFIFLQDGEPSEVNVPKGLSVINKLEDIPVK